MLSLLQLLTFARLIFLADSFTLNAIANTRRIPSFRLAASTVEQEQEVVTNQLRQNVLQCMSSLREEANQYADMFGLNRAEAAFHALFRAIRAAPIPLNMKGQSFDLRHAEIVEALQQDTEWIGFFTMRDLEKAVRDDFLDAARGSHENRGEGWKITDVSQPRGNSFEEARMTFEDVTAALEKGTVIFNAAGAHIPKLAGPSLACTDGTLLPCALNLYVTSSGKRMSAPPHTDRQDVMVVQTSGRKHWRVYTPPNPALKPWADPFARGKLDDKMAVHSMQDMGCELWIETTLNPGDVLFVPAGFPHTTSTVTDDDNPQHSQDTTSIHLTMGVDHHIWELDYLCARRLGLRRAGVKDTVLGQLGEDDSPFVGKVNELPLPVWKDLLAELPLGLLDDDSDAAAPYLEEMAATLERVSRQVDAETASKVCNWGEVAARFQQEGRELLEIHREMYLAAIDEGQKREMEDAMTAHLGKSRVLTPERMQRMSLFRVKRFYDLINQSKASLKQWSNEGNKPEGREGDLPDNWAYTMPVKVGDQVEADLGGAFFPATVTRASCGSFDVQFFDGDVETGLDRSMIKLMVPPAVSATGVDDVDTSKMTPKQLRRWKKQQEKLKKK